MPIEILVPPEGGRFGPGFHVEAFTTLPLPFPPGRQWWILVLPVGEETDWHWGDATLATTDTLFRTFAATPSQTQPPQQARPGVLDGQDVAVEISLRDGSTIVETTRVTAQWDMRSGIPKYTEARQQQIAPPTGLTPVQSAQLQQTFQMSIAGLGGPLLEAAATTLAALGPRLMTRVLITPDRTGEGVLTFPGGPFNVDAFGIAWQIVGFPSGIGIDEGAPDAFEINVLQLAKVQRLNDGTLEIADTLQTNISDSMWLWNFDVPWEVHYYLTPGVIARFWWIRVVISPPA